MPPPGPYGFGSPSAQVAPAPAWGVGGNYDGQLGNGVTSSGAVVVPVQAHGITDAVAAAAGGGQSLWLRSDGTVWASGYNGYGQLADGTTTNSSEPVQVHNLPSIVAVAAGSVTSVALGSDGSVYTWGYNADGELGNGTTTSSSIPVTASLPCPAVAIAAGVSRHGAVSRRDRLGLGRQRQRSARQWHHHRQ